MSDETPKFCRFCGTALEWKELGHRDLFSSDTGVPIRKVKERLICPNADDNLFSRHTNPQQFGYAGLEFYERMRTEGRS